MTLRVRVPAAVIERLRENQARRGLPPDVDEGEDVFLLDPGLGPALYLTEGGRILVDDGLWGNGPRHEATDDEASSALVVGAKKTGIEELLELLPEAPADTHVCEHCQGSRWRSLPGTELRVVCWECHGRGWSLN